MKKDNRMTVKEAADFLDVHTNTIYEWLRDGRLRADKEGKSYKINHMDVFDIYSSKAKVDEGKEALIGIQKTKEEVYKVLHVKCYRLLSKMEKWSTQTLNYYEEHWNRIDEFNKNESDFLKQCNHDIESFNKLESDHLGILLNARKEIESFYRTVDLIDSLEQLYKYKESKRKTLDEELAIKKALLSENMEDLVFTFNEVTDEDKLFKK